jgi:hypothetical protein
MQTDHFCITDLIENAIRLDINLLDGSELRYFDYWPQSSKQRTEYLQHVIYVHCRENTLREHTQSFEEDIKAPIHDIVRIK